MDCRSFWTTQPNFRPSKDKSATCSYTGVGGEDCQPHPAFRRTNSLKILVFHTLRSTEWWEVLRIHIKLAYVTNLSLVIKQNTLSFVAGFLILHWTRTHSINFIFPMKHGSIRVDTWTRKILELGPPTTASIYGIAPSSPKNWCLLCRV